MSAYKIITESEQETMNAAMSLAAKSGVIIALDGPLGAGKTVFARGLARSLGIREHITSPSYSIVNVYQAGDITFNHFDMYRIASEDDFLSLDFADYTGSHSICLIEWFENVRDYISEDIIRVIIEPKGENVREIFIINN